MHAKTIYQCDVCPASFDTRDEAMDHEASHFDLSPDLYGEWLALRRQAAATGHRVASVKNPETDGRFDDACKALVDFEAANGLTGKDQPITVY